MSLILHLLLALSAVLAVGRLVGRLFQRIGQPPVIGEVVGGILLGPSLLGWIAPEVFAFLLPPAITPALGRVSQLGVILYMFLVGLELDADALRRKGRTIVFTSLAGIAVPFVFGSALAIYLYPGFSTPAVPFMSFALFIGVAMSITAFPVLARILSDRGMSKSELGGLALATAAVGDVTAWCLLALVVGVVRSDAGSAAPVVLLTMLFIATMLFVARPVVLRVTRALGPSQPVAVALTTGLLLAAASTTAAIGVHALFGAFLAGAIIPHDSAVADAMHRRLERAVLLLLLPAFFAFAGLRTDLGLVSGWYSWTIVGVIVLVATAGKFGGTFVAARLGGLAAREAAGLGVLMNTRGLMELIVLNVGLDLGVISPTLFTMFVLMALATTLATTPILRRLIPT